MRRSRRDAAWNPPTKGADVTALFAVLVAVPVLLPFVSRFSLALFALPAAVNMAAAPRCLAARRYGAGGIAWRALAASAALAALASALAAVAALGPPLAKPAF